MTKPNLTLYYFYIDSAFVVNVSVTPNDDWVFLTEVRLTTNQMLDFVIALQETVNAVCAALQTAPALTTTMELN